MLARGQTPQPTPTPPAKNGTGVSPTDVYKVITALAAADLDASRVDVLVTDGRLVATPKKYLAGDWGAFNDALRALGFRWMTAGKQSHWYRA